MWFFFFFWLQTLEVFFLYSSKKSFFLFFHFLHEKGLFISFLFFIENFLFLSYYIFLFFILVCLKTIIFFTMIFVTFGKWILFCERKILLSLCCCYFKDFSVRAFGFFVCLINICNERHLFGPPILCYERIDSIPLTWIYFIDYQGKSDPKIFWYKNWLFISPNNCHPSLITFT